MRFHTALALISALSLLAACSEVRSPKSEPADEAQPDVDVRPTFEADGSPRICSIHPDEGGSWLSADSPRETLPHRLAATPGALFVASPFALRRSLDGGETFEVIASPIATESPRAMAGLGGTLFAASETGAIRSDDSGETWVGASDGLDGSIVELHRGRSALLARSDVGSLFQWSSADSQWQHVESGSFYSAGVAASDGKTVLVDTGAGVLRSTDLSAWSLVNGLEAWGYEDLLIADDLGLAITASGEIRRSHDAGVNWLPAQQSTQEVGVAARVLQHGDAMFALTSLGVVRSADGGASWGIALAEPASLNPTEVAETDGLLAVDMGEISVTRDGGATWSAAASFADSTPLAFARVGSWLLTSTHAMGVFVSDEEGSSVETDASGYFLRDVEQSDDATYLLFSERPGPTAGYGAAWATRTRDGGESFEAVPLPTTEAVWGRAFESIAVHDGVLLAGGVDALSGVSQGPGVWASSDAGESWTLASDGLPELGNSDLGAGPLYPAVLSLVRRGDAVLALLDDAGVFETRDQGASWQRVGDELPPALGAHAEGLVLAGDTPYLWSQSAGGELLRLRDGVWQPVAKQGLPYGSVRSLVAAGSSLIAAVQVGSWGTGSGVFLSNDGGESWQSLGLDARVRALFIDGETLLAGVEGQGTVSLDVGACR